jgi:hypothetical protein
LRVDPAAAELTGVYVVVREPTRTARDDVLAEGLWERSVPLTTA